MPQKVLIFIFILDLSNMQKEKIILKVLFEASYIFPVFSFFLDAWSRSRSENSSTGTGSTAFFNEAL